MKITHFGDWTIRYEESETTELAKVNVLSRVVTIYPRALELIAKQLAKSPSEGEDGDKPIIPLPLPFDCLHIIY